MGQNNKIQIASRVFSDSGFRGLLLKIIASYGGNPAHDFLSSLWGFERCTLKNDIEIVQLPASDVEYNDDLYILPAKNGENAVAGVSSGSWDLLRRPFKNSITYRTIYDLFVNGSNWSQTPRYKEEYRRIQSGDSYLDSIEELEEHINYLELLYESIKNEGFKSQVELWRESDKKKKHFQRRMGDMLVPTELRIAVGRNGEIIRTAQAHHRVSIMKILDRDTLIPAIIQFKHADFDGNLPYNTTNLNENHDLVEYSPISHP